MVSKINTKIINPLPSDESQIGGEWANAIIDLFHGVFLGEENLSIGTPIRWKPGSLLVYDGTSHSVSIETEDIATGALRHAIFREMTLETDYIVMENETQVIKNKEFHTGNKYTTNLNMDNHGITNADFYNIRDMLNNDISLVAVTGIAEDAHIDFLSNYRTESFANISAADGILVTFGYQSEIDGYYWYSEADGTNKILMSLTHALFSVDSDVIDLNGGRIDNFDQNVIKLRDNVSDYTANATNDMIFRNDIDVNNHALWISKIENGSVVKVRVT